MAVIGRFTNLDQTMAAVIIDGIEYSGVNFDAKGSVVGIGEIPGKVRMLVEMGGIVAPYVPPPSPPLLTPAERFTAKTGLTVAELKELIAG